MSNNLLLIWYAQSNLLMQIRQCRNNLDVILAISLRTDLRRYLLLAQPRAAMPPQQKQIQLQVHKRYVRQCRDSLNVILNISALTA